MWHNKDKEWDPTHHQYGDAATKINNTRLEIMNEGIRGILAQDIIVPSDSLYLFNVVLVKNLQGCHSTKTNLKSQCL